MGKATPDKHSKDFKELENIILQSKQRVWTKVNYEQIYLYWLVGEYVSAKLEASEWGQSIVDNFSEFLKARQPLIKGFSRRGIYRMVRFYNTYFNSKFVSAMLAQLPREELGQFVSALPTQIQNTDIKEYHPILLELLAQISWSAHLEILSGCESDNERLFYILLAKKERLTYRELGRQIESSAYERTMSGNQKLTEKIKEAYPNIDNVLKDRYMVDFLRLPKDHNEKDVRDGILTKMKNFILDLGKDFLFVDKEYRVQVGMNDFYIDLLFYHRSLRCFVAFELKSTKFKPEHLGKLEFYLEALDRDVKRDDENPSIGVLLCKSTDDEVVEYALSRSVSPAMIAKYEQELIPKSVLKSYLKEIN